MQLTTCAFGQFDEAMQRGWGERDSRTPMLLQNERAGVEPHVPAEKLRKVLDECAPCPTSAGTGARRAG